MKVTVNTSEVSITVESENDSYDNILSLVRKLIETTQGPVKTSGDTSTISERTLRELEARRVRDTQMYPLNTPTFDGLYRPDRFQGPILGPSSPFYGTPLNRATTTGIGGALDKGISLTAGGW